MPIQILQKFSLLMECLPKPKLHKCNFEELPFKKKKKLHCLIISDGRYVIVK